jgi:hypothetical protein
MRVKSYRKKIACLESLWDGNTENRLRVIPILQLVAQLHDLKFTYLTCNTKEELKYNLNKLKKKSGYGILYLAFHGNPEEILLDGSSIKVGSIASFMGRGFKNWIVHFGSCKTIATEKKALLHFIEVTGVSMVLGYAKDINWRDAAALDFLILDWLQEYKDMKKMWGEFRKRYSNLIALTGVKALHNHV